MGSIWGGRAILQGGRLRASVPPMPDPFPPAPPPPDAVADLILVGGGLANGLLALRLAGLRPELRVLMLEAGPRLGAGHTWSFFERDLTEEQRGWVAPLVAHRWPGYAVRFPALRRRLSSGYASVSDRHFHDALMARLGDRVRLNTPVARLSGTEAVLADGTVLRAGAVVDGRGPWHRRRQSAVVRSGLC